MCTFLFAGELAAQLFQLALPDMPGPAARLPAVPLLCASACEPVLQPACSFAEVHGASPPPARAHCQITNMPQDLACDYVCQCVCVCV